MWNNNKKIGNTLIELVMVMSLSILFGVSIITLIQTGNNTQKSITKKMESQVEARTAISYINVRIRQNDIKGQIEVRQNNINNENSLVITDNSFETTYETWIYFHEGVLYECIVLPNEEIKKELSFEISKIDNYEVTFDDEKNVLLNKIYYNYGKSLQNISYSTVIRSDSYGRQ